MWGIGCRLILTDPNVLNKRRSQRPLRSRSEEGHTHVNAYNGGSRLSTKVDLFQNTKETERGLGVYKSLENVNKYNKMKRTYPLLCHKSLSYYRLTLLS